MMPIRAFKESDIETAKSIHDRFFSDQFEFPDLMKTICSFVVEDENIDRPVCIGGVRTLAEVVLLTDKNFDARTRRTALYEVLAASSFVAKRSGHDSLHAFIQEPLWLHHLKRAGFIETVGKSLYYHIKE